MQPSPECITYKKGYKYQLIEEYATETGILLDDDMAIADYISLSANGRITIMKGYAWDGPTNPAIDTLNFMRASLVHDALYQLMRNEKLARDPYRKVADELLRKMCREDGMSYLRAAWVYRAVRVFGDSAASPVNIKRPQRAPASCQ